MNQKIEINRGAPTTMGQSGVGYIVVPDDNARKQYIENCYRTSTVTINGGYGYGYISSVKIFPDVLQKIKFPISQEERGTPIFWVRENFSNRPVVVGILSEEGMTNLLTENQERLVQQFGDNVVEIFLDANSSTLNINVIGGSENPSEINIKNSSKGGNSLMNIESDGKISVSSNELIFRSQDRFSLSLKSTKDEELISISGNSEEFEYKDSFGNKIIADKNNINVQSGGRVNINGDSQPMILGEALYGIINELLSSIQKMTFMANGQVTSAPINISEFVSIQEKLDTIKSKKNFLG